MYLCKKLCFLGVHSVNTYVHTKLPHYDILEQFEALKSLIYIQHTTFIYSYFSTQNLHEMSLYDLDLAKIFKNYLLHAATLTTP